MVKLFGGVALFLFGMKLMGDGLKSVAGNKMEMIVWKLSSTVPRGLLLGIVVTAAIQSSSATAVMTVGFVNSGIMNLSQATAIILGANVGTSITGWVVVLSAVSTGGGLELFSTATLSAVIAVVGIGLVMFSKKAKQKSVGNILMGFAVLMFGMQSMSGAVAPLKESPGFVGLLTLFSNPIVGFLVGTAFAAVLQSSSAAVGILQALSLTGAITFGEAFPLILGIGVGASFPVFLSSIGANRDGKRTAILYALNIVVGAVICGAVFYVVQAGGRFAFVNAPVDAFLIALTNTLYRVVAMLVLAPFTGLLGKLVRALVKDDPQERAALAEIDRLEERFITHPALAIEQCRIALDSMAQKARENILDAMELLSRFSEEGFKQVEKLEDVVDKYEDRLGTYMVKFTGQPLSHEQTREVSVFLHTISDFERMSDHALNIAEVAREISEKKVTFSAEAQGEIQVILDAVKEVLDLAVRTFMGQDVELAKRVEPLEDTIDVLCDEAKLRHVNRVQAGNCSLNQGFVFNDLLTNLERVADHCSNVAVVMIELNMDAYDIHEYTKDLKYKNSEKFSAYAREYSAKYALP